ncbi:unnamed protein product [Bursaphelenchus okinawaensis]|uniref:Checkpoint protein n=1 Tax=Bursaphelenchus okinawaensis TaxID=465554 RepID=A0A811L1C8_9BILA|nr:unnamed protein product [Bursaphelenchus okinawaensis]CAG9116909.1 unnamed protein product [Bursaphelenchus okinawaensis]
MTNQVATLKFNAVIEGIDKVGYFVKRLIGVSEFYAKSTLILTISEDSFVLCKGVDSVLSSTITELWLNNKQCFDQYEFMETERGQVSFEIESDQLNDVLRGIEVYKQRVDMLKLRVAQVDSNLYLRIKIPNLNATHDINTELKPLADLTEYRMPVNNKDYTSAIIPESGKLERILTGFKNMDHPTVEFLLWVSKKQLRISGSDTDCSSTIIMKDLDVTQKINGEDDADILDKMKVRISLQNLHTVLKGFLDSREPVEVRVTNQNSARFVVQKTDGIFTLHLSHIHD